ncbi:hypothetical protein [Streptomyces daliensis]|uniref:Integral membrane protein n=1 Tax=Streptomyces daliensis TaxID=299421 RepID=A0A8T4J4A9_9ACTN|nr:hypothetical protein [Streptomyces daliensis]
MPGGTAAVLALCLVAALPGSALAAGEAGGADVPGYGIAEDARQIKGAASSGDGPELKPGTYRDTIGRGEKRYYSVNLDAKSSAFLSAVAAPEPGSKVGTVGEGLEISLETVDGDECGSDDPQFRAGGRSYPIAGTASRLMGEDDECQKAGPYLLSVERVGSDTSGRGRWPLELRYMSEPGLKGSVPTAPGDNGADDEPPTPVTGSAKKQANGGTGFNDAGALSTGVWKDAIEPGETRFYRVPVDWGQRLNTSVELSSSSEGGEFPPTVFNALGLTAYNPARGQLEDDDFTDYHAESASVGAYTPVVDFGNRFANSGAEAPFAGWYYLEVTASPELAKYFKKSAPLTLRVDVRGKAKEAPAYDGDAVAAGFGVSEDDREQAEEGLSAAEAERSGTLRTVAVTGIGVGAGLILVLVAWTLIARRRAGRDATVTSAPHPQQPQNPQQPQPYGYPPSGNGWQ